MSWAARRRLLYLSGVILFFVIVFGGPVAYWYFSIPPTCFDGIQNQGETAVDQGGPCLALDPRTLQSYALLWTRSFKVRDGSYNAVAYVQNPNKEAGVESVSYKFSLYDAQNILIAERTGTTYLMPGSVTPIFEAGIDTGNRVVVHTYFEFTEPMQWIRAQEPATSITVGDQSLTDTNTAPRLSATVRNSAVADIVNPGFVAVVFDTSGNAFAASRTQLDALPGNGSAQIVFTWPDTFPSTPGRVDIIPMAPPAPAQTR